MIRVRIGLEKPVPLNLRTIELPLTRIDPRIHGEVMAYTSKNFPGNPVMGYAIIPLPTPGPWEVKEVRGEIFVAGKPYEGHPYFNRTTTVEIMSDEDYPTKEADAHLISAALDLLAALKLCLDFCRGHQETEVGIKRYELVRSAIEKAENEKG